MKKFTILLVALFAAISYSSAQKGEKSIGFSLGYGSDIESLGLSARFQYGITDKIRLAPDFTYFFENNGLSMWETNLNGHYLFPINDKMTVYPIGGIVISHWSWNVDYTKVPGLEGKINASDTDFGINLGGGFQYNFSEKIMFNGEFKYGLVSNYDQAVISAGVAFKF